MKRFESKYLIAAAVFVAAFLIRLVYFLQIKANFPGWDTPTIDPLFHDLWARQIAAGDLLGVGPFFRAPFYAYFLGLIYALFDHSLIAARIIQHLIGSLTCALIFLFTEKYFNRRIALLSGIVAIFYWVFIYFEDELLLDSLLTLLSLTLVWLLLRAAATARQRTFFLAGLVLGLAAITRPNYLAFWPVILIWLILVFGNRFKVAVGRFIILSLGCLIMIMPVTLRNIIVGDDLVLIASQGGINFYIGNNRYADGASAIMPEFGATWQYADCEYLARVESGKLGSPMRPSGVSSFFFRRALRFITEEPLHWLALMFKKFTYFWNSYEISNNQNLYFFRRFASISKIMPPLFFIISPLSLIGLVALFRRKRELHIIAYFVITYMLSVIAFFVTARFRLPVLPFLIILASAAIMGIVDKVRTRDYKRLTAITVALAILLLLSNIDFFGISHQGFAMSHFSLGNVYLKKGMTEKALDEYGQAIVMEPCVPSAHLNRGIIYFGRLDFAKAREEFRLEIEKCRGSAQAHNNLSVLDRLEGDPESALSEARQAIAQAPQYTDAYVNKILALRSLGRNDSAFATAEYLNAIFPEYLPGHYFKGLILKEQGELDSAEIEFRAILKKNPPNIVEKYDLSTIYTSQTRYGYKPERMPGLADFELGNILVARGQIDSALTFFQKTTEILPDYADGWLNLALAYDHRKSYPEALQAYKKSVDLEPENAIAYYNLGLTLGKVGLLNEAAESFRIALEIDPEFSEAREKLQLTESLLESDSR